MPGTRGFCWQRFPTPGCPGLKPPLRPSWCKLFAAAVLIALLAGCGGRPPLYQEQAYVFGTLVEVSIYGEPEARARELAGEVMARFQQLHRDLHAWEPSKLTVLNAAFAQGPSASAPVDPELKAILEDAARLSRMSGGLFNPAIGRLVELWGFHSDTFKPVLPDPRKVARLVAAHPSMDDVIIKDGRAHSTNPAVAIDLGGYAKGYALDVAAKLLASQGVKNALINIGGNIMALGKHGDRPWRVGIQDPRKPKAIAALDLRDGEAIGTSGDYQRYFIVDGRRYCHVIDPRTGYPVQGVEAATIVAPPGPGAGALSDAASKPVFIAGPAGWRDAARKMGIELALLIDGRGEVYVTRAFKRRLEFLEPGLTIHEVP